MANEGVCVCVYENESRFDRWSAQRETSVFSMQTPKHTPRAPPGDARGRAVGGTGIWV